MAGIEDPNVIDLVAQDANGEYMVVMVETRPWGVSCEQPDQLKQKINAYVGYILDGDLARQYPEAAEKPVRIQLNCAHTPRGEIATITEWAARQLSQHGIGFAVTAKDQAT
jgi:hypothetical protein